MWASSLARSDWFEFFQTHCYNFREGGEAVLLTTYPYRSNFGRRMDILQLEAIGCKFSAH
jgi:hypothetical protein